MSLTKVNISWKQSPCYTCACLLKVPIPPFQWWYRFVSTKRVALLISGKNDENPVFRGRFLSSVLERKESLPGCDIQRNTFLPLLVSSAFGKCGNHGWRWANSGEQGLRWTTKQSGGAGWTLNYQAATGGFPFASSYYWYFCQLVEVKI